MQSIPARTPHRSGGVSDRRGASRSSVVWGVARLKADLISSFPVDVFRKVGGSRQEATTPPWLDTPEPGMDIVDWLDALSMSLDFDGNAFGIVTPGVDGWPSSVTLLDPKKVTVRRNRSGLVEHVFEREVIPPSNVFHVRGPMFPGMLRGLSPIEYAAVSIGTGIAGREYVAQFFSDGAHPTIEVIADEDLTKDEADALKASVVSVLSGNREPWVHGSGISTKTWQLSPVAAGFLEAIQATDLDICRFMGLRQPEMIGVTMPANGSLNYANLEQRGIALQQFTMASVVRRIERALSRLTPRGQFVKLNMDAIQRPDSLTRTRIEDMRVRNGTWSRDDVRRLEDEPPIPDGTGDEYLWPPYRTTPIASEGGGNAAT